MQLRREKGLKEELPDPSDFIDKVRRTLLALFRFSVACPATGCRAWLPRAYAVGDLCPAAVTTHAGAQHCFACAWRQVVRSRCRIAQFAIDFAPHTRQPLPHTP